MDWWTRTGLVDCMDWWPAWTGGLDWTGLVDGGLDWWTAWTGGLDWWTDTKICFPTTRQGSLACGVVWEPCT